MTVETVPLDEAIYELRRQHDRLHESHRRLYAMVLSLQADVAKLQRDRP